MTAGECDYAAIDKFRCDPLFQALAGKSLPSQATFRQRLDALAAKKWQDVLDVCVAHQLSMTTLTRVKAGVQSFILVDIDVSVLEDTASNKEGVSMSYHNVIGYAPIFAYAGCEGYMVAHELRPGSQHSAKGAVEFLRRCVGILLQAGCKAEELLVRVDSGHDSSDFIKELDALGVNYLVKRNPRDESPEQLLDSIRNYEESERPRHGKTIYRGFRSDLTPANYP